MTLTLVSSATPPQQSRATQLRVYTISDPAAGVDWSESVPAGEAWQLQALKYSFVASAVVATRAPNLHPVMLGAGFGVVPAPLTVAASTTVTYFYAAGVVVGTGPNVASAPLTSFLYPPGSQIGTQTGNIQSSDQLINITLYVLAYV